MNEIYPFNSQVKLPYCGYRYYCSWFLAFANLGYPSLKIVGNLEISIFLMKVFLLQNWIYKIGEDKPAPRERTGPHIETTYWDLCPRVRKEAPQKNLKIENLRIWSQISEWLLESYNSPLSCFFTSECLSFAWS